MTTDLILVIPQCKNYGMIILEHNSIQMIRSVEGKMSTYFKNFS